MASDNPKKDSAVDFLRDIIPAFAGSLDRSRSAQLGVEQRSVRSVSTSDVGRVFVSAYSKPKGYEDDTLRYHHVFPVFVVLESDAKYITALNPFYLPREPRAKLVSGLLKNLNSTSLDISAKTNFNYNLIKNNVQGAILKPAIKKYIKSRMSQVVIQLSPSLWEQMYLGESSRTLETLWDKTSSQQVYGDFVRDVLKELNR
jgi:hypothetical protein|tara:strand:+ start:19 stop:621 length:603 start_codon:yes stop_codon:yes gene_type:complete